MKSSPVATPKSVITIGKARFTFITPRLLRLEWAGDAQFEDRATLSVQNRRAPSVSFRHTTSGTSHKLETSGLTVSFKDDDKPFSAKNLSIRLKDRDTPATWKPGTRDPKNLLGTNRTLDGDQAGMKIVWGEDKNGNPIRSGWKRNPLCPGYLSRSGWAFVDDSENILLDETLHAGRRWVTSRPRGRRTDWYFLGYGLDFKQALRDAAIVFGSQPLPPRYTLGYWFSRYWAYTDREFNRIVDQFDRMQVPLDVMVVDMDWHLLGWTGYTWEKAFFPDPTDFLQSLKKRDLKITLNLHPADGVAEFEEAFPAMCKELGLNPRTTKRIPFNCTDPKFIDAYFKHLHHPEEDRGVDFWWMDWQQGTGSGMDGLDPLPWLNQIHWEDMEQRTPARRPLCFSRFGGHGAGRYPIGFSGDTLSTWKSLAYQPWFTATASNILYGYWSHDIGGHDPGPVTPELYLRWVQFGAFSPILRTHTTKLEEAERRFWEYPDPFGSHLMDAVRLRYEMVPYIYTENRRAMDSGVSLLRPMYYEHPKTETAYKAKEQYYFGEKMLVAPVVNPVAESDNMADAKVWLPAGDWFDTARGLAIKGNRWITGRYLPGEIPTFVRPGTVIPGQIAPQRLTPGSYRDLLLTVYPGGNGDYSLYEDDGISQDYLNKGSAELPIRYREKNGTGEITLAPAKGSFKGFLASRTLEVRIPGTVPPKALTAGGKPLTWAYRLASNGWTYDADTATTIIRLKLVNVKKGLTLKVQYGGPHRTANGIKGILARLQEVARVLVGISYIHTIHPEERLGVALAQLGNRVARKPETFASELRAFRKDLGRMPKVIRQYQANLRAKQNAELDARAKRLDFALAVLKETLRLV